MLYADEDLRLLPEELWWTPQPRPDARQHLAGGAAVARAAHAARSPVNLPEASAGDGPLTDSDDSDASSVASIEVAGGCVDDDGIGGGRALDLDKKWRPLQLHTVAAALRDSAKTVAQVDALQKLEQLVRYGTWMPQHSFPQHAPFSSPRPVHGRLGGGQVSARLLA